MHNGGVSQLKERPGGGPAGTTLGMIMFVILINHTANPGQKTNWGKLLTSPIAGRRPVQLTHGKLIDDATIGEAILLEEALVTREEEAYWTRPLRRRERNQTVVPDAANLTKKALDEVVMYAN